MSNILQYLTTSDSYIEIGSVQESLGGKKYRVEIRGRDTYLTAAVEYELKPGDQVVINRTKYDSYIVGTTQRIKSYIEKEIVVNG